MSNDSLFRRYSAAVVPLVALLMGLSVRLSAAPAAPSPPLIALLLDTSGSIRPEDLGRVQTLTRNLLASLPKGWEIAVYKFNDDSRMLLERTAQAQQIEGAIGSLKREGRFTALYDALFDASQYLEGQPSQRRVILLLTDGKNEGGQTNLEDGLVIARRRRIPIFTVGMGKAVNQRVLRRISEQTGGLYMDISTATGEALAKAIQQAAGPALTPQSPGKAAPGKAQSLPAARRISWLLVLTALITVLGGLCLWWALRRRKSLESKPSADLNATTPAQKSEPIEDLRTVRAPVLPRTADPTVRIQLKESSLIVREGQGAGLIFPVRPTKTTLLGRSPSAEVPLHDPTASYEHCRILPAGVGYVLTDLNSTNGTIVNGALVKEHVLRDGDVIRVGSTSFEFSFAEPAS